MISFDATGLSFVLLHVASNDIILYYHISCRCIYVAFAPITGQYTWSIYFCTKWYNLTPRAVARTTGNAQYIYKGNEYGAYTRVVLYTTRGILKIIGLFCKRALSKRLYSAKETYDFKERIPTTRGIKSYYFVHVKATYVIIQNDIIWCHVSCTVT